MSSSKPDPRPALVVLISGAGTNLQAIIDEIAAGRLPVRLAAVISNRPDAPGLERARRAGVPAVALDHRGFPDRAAFDRQLAAIIDRYSPDLIVLAGYMRILTPDFVRRYAGRVINLHPSLLPKYPGLDTHARVLAAGDREHGATVHFVTEALDNGPVLVQERCPVEAGDTPERLRLKVQQIEHRILPAAIRLLAERQLAREKRR
jgi:phosphoribosylglycinamide formyltransferase-1